MTGRGVFRLFTSSSELIRRKIRDGEYIVSFTHTEKVRLRKIEANEIEEAVINGMIIES